MKLLILLIVVSVMTQLNLSNANKHLRELQLGNDQWQQCVGTQVLKCASCIFTCGADIAEVILSVGGEIADGEPEMIITDIPDIMDMIKDCADCVSACQVSVQQFNSECPSTNHCTTDFCYACCQQGASVCVGNDWTPVCTVPQRTCKCSSNSYYDSNSCCSNSGPGSGQNTGNFCGNDFHSNACTPEAPYCCNNNLNQAVCCKEDGVCGGGAIRDQYCTSSKYLSSMLDFFERVF